MTQENINEKVFISYSWDSCNFTSGLICTDRLIFLESPLCVGFFRSEF